MRNKHIEVVIDDQGNASVEGHGFSGPECERNMQEIETALGVTRSQQFKPEYRQVQPNRNIQRGGR
jgi:hypothetical protein